MPVAIGLLAIAPVTFANLPVFPILNPGIRFKAVSIVARP
jgi:hypothetical protein